MHVDTQLVQGRVQVISSGGLHELHIFIFVLAVAHVLYSCVTVLLGLWQVSRRPIFLNPLLLSILLPNCLQYSRCAQKQCLVCAGM
jgi:hypothetical protein